MKGWISVEEEMPEEGERVIVYYNGIEMEHYSIGYLKWMGDEWMHMNPGDMEERPEPTHWRPLL